MYIVQEGELKAKKYEAKMSELACKFVFCISRYVNR